jgi:O-antigen/teichoic acid export membrane protein
MLLNTEAVRGLRLIRTFAFMHALPALSALVFLVGAAPLVETRNLPLYAQLAAAAVTALAGLVIMDRTFKRRIQAQDVIHPMTVRDIVAVSLPMLLSAAMFFVIGQTGILMLGIFRTDTEVGYYAIAVKLASLSAVLLAAINSMAAPKFSELFHAGQTDEMLRVAKKSTRLIFWTTTPALLGLIVLGRPMLSLLFGEQFTGAYAAMVILALGQFVNATSGSTGIFLNMTGHEKAFQNIIVGAAGLNVVLNVVLIPRLGIEGAAVAAMVTMVCWNGAALLYIKAKFGRSIGYFPPIRLPAARG